MYAPKPEGGLDMFRKLRDYNRRFWSDESGAEMVEIAVGLAVAAAMIGIVIGIVVKVNGYIKNAGESLDTNLQDLDKIDG